MTIQHLRNLGKYGVIADGDPYNLPPEAFSAAVNVRFRNGKVLSGPVFRNVKALTTANPRYAFASNPASGLDLLFIGYLGGNVSLFSGTAETDYTPTGYTPSAVEAAWSSTTLASVTYVNRSDRSPWYLRTSDAKFQDLSASGWDTLWQTQLLRACAGTLVALNVTKNGTHFPTMVKTSSIPLAGDVPTSWDITEADTLATENILAEMQGPINDACSLGGNLIIYGFKEAWAMQPTQALDVFSYTKLPFQKGSLSSNCSQEWDGKNVVFGPDDIWLHDGTSEKSICNGRVRDYIFGALNLKFSNRCFVQHNPRQTEMVFGYVSGDPLTAFNSTLTNGCNRQAVWNYVDDTWSFDDTPDVFACTEANLSTAVTYETVAATYDTVGGSYQDQEDGFKRTSVYVGQANTSYSLTTSLYAFDLFGQGSTVSYAVDLNATKPRFIERTGIDLDELNEDLRDYKVLATIYPQARLGSGAANMMFDAGAADSFGLNAAYIGYQPYNGDDLYKCDFNAAGRWLSYRMQFADYKEMALTGVDLDLKATGKR